MRLYIAGPMRGIPLFNFPAFDYAANILRGLGCEVENPAEIDRRNGFSPESLDVGFDWTMLPDGMDIVAIVERDVAALLKCDAVVTLDGWERSTGARAEVAVAKWAGKPVVSFDDFGG